jgi:hypothetical protein
MEVDLKSREVRFALYGVDDPARPDKLVSAEVFSRKVRSLIAVLKEADKAVNHSLPHEFLISHLKLGSAEVGMLERPAKIDAMPYSAVAAFADCASAIQRGDFASASKYNGLGNSLVSFSKGAGDHFSHMDVLIDQVAAIRVDDFFEKQVATFVALPKEEMEKKFSTNFAGRAFDAFDGCIKEVDLRGSIWRGKLVLTAGSKEIDCAFRNFSLDEVKANLDQRIWAEGFAIYSEQSGLPQRLEISKMRPIKMNADLGRWRGAFNPDEVVEWGGTLDERDQ